MIPDELVRKIAFCGSPATGAREARLAAGGRSRRHERLPARAGPARDDRALRRARLRAGLMICDRLRSDCDRVWEGLHAHPFIRELAAGTLPPDTFRFYVEQNLQYLPEYARTIALGAAKAEDSETMGCFAADLANIIDSEIPENRELLRARARARRGGSGWRGVHGARERRLHRLPRLGGGDGRAARDHGRDRAVHVELRRHRLVADRRGSRARPSGIRRVDPLLRPARVRRASSRR